jgi:hypothetical protein
VLRAAGVLGRVRRLPERALHRAAGLSARRERELADDRLRSGLAIRVLADGNGISDDDATSDDDANADIPGDDYLSFHGENGDVIQGYASYVLLVSLDKLGAFKKATWKTLGADMIHFSTYFRTPASVFGGFKASGATVPAEKVPEGARALMLPGMCPAI